MEQWESLIQGYPNVPSLRDVTKALDCASAIWKTDLAPFEIDWLLQTLLSQPVCLLAILLKHSSDDSWSNATSRSFELLAILAQSDCVKPYLDNIVHCCQASYLPHVRKRAYQCLISIARLPHGGDAMSLIHTSMVDALITQEAVTVRVVRAELVGEICEYYPELVGGRENEIWRIYLSILEAAKTTDSLINGVVTGLNGLFKHFGQNLPTAEINQFYQKLSTNYIYINSCKDACYALLRNHSRLFPERVSRDVTLRTHLWSCDVADVLCSVYDVAVTADNVQSIICTEVLPRITSKESHARNAANRIMAAILKKFNYGLDDARTIYDKHLASTCVKAEFGLSCKLDTLPPAVGKWQHDGELMSLVQQASWCIESGLVGCDILLQYSMLLYAHISPTLRRKMVVHTLLTASDDLRKGAITFLISETCQSTAGDSPAVASRLALWRDLFDSMAGKDRLVADRSQLVFEDYMGYLFFVLETLLESDLGEDKTNQKLSSLLLFSVQLLTFEGTRDYIDKYAEATLSLLLECARRFALSDALILFISALVGVVDENCGFEDGSVSRECSDALSEFYERLCIERARDEAAHCASCLALVQAPSMLLQQRDRVVAATQVIFSRSDVEPQILTKTLVKFENLLLDEKVNIPNEIVCGIVSSIEKLRLRTDLVGKEARILHRDVLLFLGKYGNRGDINYIQENSYKTSIVQLRNVLVLNLPNPKDGTNLKINLDRILDLALAREDPSALQALLLILCSALASSREEVLQRAVTAVTSKLARCHSRGDATARVDSLQLAVRLCDSEGRAASLVQYIAQEQSPGVRKILSNVLERQLLSDQHSESAIRIIVEGALCMMETSHSTTKRAGLDIAETIASVIKDNNSATIEYTTKLLESVARTNEKDFEIAYEAIAKHFIDKILLFNPDSLETTAHCMYNNLTSIVYDQYVFEKLVELSMDTIKKIAGHLKWNDEKLLQLFSCRENSEKDVTYTIKYLYVISAAKVAFEFGMNVCRKLVYHNDYQLINCVEGLLDAGKVFERNTVEYNVCLITLYEVLGQYSEAFLEVKYQATLVLLSSTISLTTPKFVQNMHRRIEQCIDNYQRFWKKNTPHIISAAYEKWFDKIPVISITSSIERKEFLYEHANFLSAMRKMLKIIKIDDTKEFLLELQDSIARWPTIILKLFASKYVHEYLKNKLSYLTDILALHLTFATKDNVKNVIKEGSDLHGYTNEGIGLKFCVYFIHAYAPYILEHDILSEPDMENYVFVLHDVIKMYGRQKCSEEVRDKIIELLDKLWPRLQSQSSSHRLSQLLTDVAALQVALPWSSAAGQWWLATMRAELAVAQRVRVLQALPVFAQDGAVEHYREAYEACIHKYSTTLPVKLSLASSEETSSLQALLEVTATTREPTLLRAMMNCVVNDEANGWWDDAIAKCVARIACEHDASVLDAVFAASDANQTTLCSYERVLLPLIRNTSTSVAEVFFAARLGEVLTCLRRTMRAASDSFAHRRYLVQCARAFMLAQCCFERLPLSTLESPSSRLYANIDLKRSKNLAQEVCKLCVNIRKEVTCPADAGSDMSRFYRQLHCASFNCLAAVLCKTRANVKIFNCIFDRDAYAQIVDAEKTYVIYIETFGLSTTKRHSVSVSPDASDASLTQMSQFTARTAVFLRRTLSDNPLQYDLLNYEHIELQAPTQTLILPDNDLNSHPAAANLTAAVQQLSKREWHPWLGRTKEILTGDVGCNVKWFLTQVILNCKEDLKEQASFLTPALLRVVSSTPYEKSGKKLLNGLHVNVLNTVSNWLEATDQNQINLTTEEACSLNKVIDLLVHTCVHHKQNTHVFKALVSCLNNIVKALARFVEVKFDVFEEYLKDATNEPTIYQLLLSIARNNIHIERLIPATLARLEAKAKSSSAAELFGLAVASCGSDAARSAALQQFWQALGRMRRAGEEQQFVAVLFYAQSAWPACCDESCFKHTAYLAPKLLREQKAKCFEIISTYIARSPPSEYVTDMFGNVDVCEHIINDNTAIALKLAASGLKSMSEGLRRRVVFLTSDYCDSSVLKVRRLALDVMLQALHGLFPPKESEPLFKRARQTTTPLLSLQRSADAYSNTVVGRVGLALRDVDPQISANALNGVANAVNTNDMGIRFCECLLVTVLLPSTVGSERPGHVARCVTSQLTLFFRDLRTQERFAKLKLREEPLDVGDSSRLPGSAQLLTLSKAFQGTFRSRFSGRGVRKDAASFTVPSTTALNVDIPLNDILESLFEFARISPEVANILFLEVIKSIQKQAEDASDYNHNLAEILHSVLKRDRMSEVTPTIVEACRLCVDACCALPGFKSTIDKLMTETVRSEGECVVRLLCEDFALRTEGRDQFVLGKHMPDIDVEMQHECDDFSMQDLVATFGKLSNWDELTVQQRRGYQRAGIPAIWTDVGSFGTALDDMNDKSGWLSKMHSALLHRNTQSAHPYKWLTEMDGWPRKSFDVSAVTEAIEWHTIVNEADLKRLPVDIKPSDCLAEWAARLMIRSLYIQGLAADNDSESQILQEQYGKRIREQQLCYSAAANASHLPELALQCVKHNISEIHESETLSWLHQQVVALRAMGRRRHCPRTLQRALDKAETFSQQYGLQSTPDVVCAMEAAKLMLCKDLNVQTREGTNSVLSEIDAQNQRVSNDKVYANKSQSNILSAYEHAMCFYDDAWNDTGDTTQQDLVLSDMIACLGRCLDMKSESTADMFLAMILDKIPEYMDTVLSVRICTELFQKLEPIARRLDNFTVEDLKRLRAYFPPQVLDKHPQVKAKLTLVQVEVDRYKSCLELVCDPPYTLMQYCEALATALSNSDLAAWDSTFERLSALLFENSSAGSSYQLLAKYKDMLDEIKEYDITKEFKTKAKKTLAGIHSELSKAGVKSVLNLSDLCPALTRHTSAQSEGDNLNKILGLDSNVGVVKFEREVVVLGSLRRPCVVRAVLSTGRVRRFLVKRGEPLRTDAAACRALRLLSERSPWRARGYSVTPLSDDCAIIEFLEDHVTLRSMIGKKFNLDAIATSVRRAEQEELIITSPASNLSHYNALCQKVPPHTLRSSIEDSSSCVQDFVQMKRVFLDTFSAMTIFHWILGLGDRHLENSLFCARSGALCGVDLAAILQYGDNGALPEIPAARCTAQLTAVCDVHVFESRMQTILTSLRESNQLLVPAIKTCFKWMPNYTSQEFQKKMSFIKKLLQGSAQSYEITREVIQASPKIKYRENYVKLLDDVFADCGNKDSYTVEEQVTCLLRQCTDPRILCITRNGWEPWL